MNNVRIVSGVWAFDDSGKEVVRVRYIRDGLQRTVHAASMRHQDVEAAIEGDVS